MVQVAVRVVVQDILAVALVVGDSSCGLIASLRWCGGGGLCVQRWHRCTRRLWPLHNEGGGHKKDVVMGLGEAHLMPRAVLLRRRPPPL